MKDIPLIRAYRKIRKRLHLFVWFGLRTKKNEVISLILPDPLKESPLKTFSLYRYLWFAENCLYYSQKLKYTGLTFSFTRGIHRIAYFSQLSHFAVFELLYDFNSYFNLIQPAERALIRKSMKNGFICKEILYDDYIDQIREINISKETRGGRPMSEDYIHPRKRDAVVKPYNPQIFTYGVFAPDNKLVAYYMFEHITNFFHTVKGIGHKDYLKYGIMNHLFAYSVSELAKLQLANWIVYGIISNNPCDGLSNFKKHVGCSAKYLLIEGKRNAFDHVKYLCKNYTLHGDTALNFVKEYSDSSTNQQTV